MPASNLLISGYDPNWRERFKTTKPEVDLDVQADIDVNGNSACPSELVSPFPPSTFTHRYNPGDFVTWTSGAAGFNKTKTGKIIAVVPKNERISAALEALGQTRESYKLEANNLSSIDRYLIHVLKDNQKVNHLYAPAVTLIDRNATFVEVTKVETTYGGV